MATNRLAGMVKLTSRRTDNRFAPLRYSLVNGRSWREAGTRSGKRVCGGAWSSPACLRVQGRGAEAVRDSRRSRVRSEKLTRRQVAAESRLATSVPQNGGVRRDVTHGRSRVRSGQQFLDADPADDRLARSVVSDVNGGVSGETSSGLLDRLDWVLRQRSAVIVVETGANDGLRGQPVEALKANIDEVLSRRNPRRPTLGWCWCRWKRFRTSVRNTRGLSCDVTRLGREKGVTLLPFLLDGVAGQRELNQADGIHPNYAGERIVAANVWGARADSRFGWRTARSD